MNETSFFEINDPWVVEQRPPKNDVDPFRPYEFLLEKERTHTGDIVETATIFLTNRECPFRCLMCDLWKNTTDETVPSGAIPAQIEWALQELPDRAKQIKLYNSGNFFDSKAIPPEDLPKIADLVRGFDNVVIENHPKLVSGKCVDFAKKLGGRLEVAMGLETVHPGVLGRLNKRMTMSDYQKATRFLVRHGIAVRAFVLLRPPFLDEDEGVEWAKKTIDFAFDVGVECCAVIPTRAGNGALDALWKQGLFKPPTLASLEEVFDYGIEKKSGRVFADLWDLEQFSKCDLCLEDRKQRLYKMNMAQVVLPRVPCECSRR